MFGDWGWQTMRKHEQQMRFRHWRDGVAHPVVIEIGAGTTIPSVRLFGEAQGCPLIRITPRESQVGKLGDVGLPMGALEALQSIANFVKGYCVDSRA
jgi:hypothetical protein